MKHLLSLLLFIALTGISFTQNITIYKKSGAILTADLSKIDSLNFTDSQCPATVTYGGKTYNTVTIGEQCWFKENLNVGKFISSGTAQTNNNIIEKWCYSNDTNNCNAYGGLYIWSEAMQYAPITGTIQGICPTGWHLPTSLDFRILAKTVNEVGNSLKAIGQGNGTGAGTNVSGFSALLAGCRLSSGSFTNIGLNIYLWSSSEYDVSSADRMVLPNNDSGIYTDGRTKGDGNSVRCLKDN